MGDVKNAVEPFAGSLAWLLARPGGAQGIETVNDLDCYVANFWRTLAAWRATDGAPDHPVALDVARWADWPVNEADLHARHRWLVEQADFRARMRSEPEYFDAKVAGWWVWGLCAWIGSGWCDVARVESGGDDRARAQLAGGEGHHGNGVHSLSARQPEKLPLLGGTTGAGVHRRGLPEQLIHLGNGGRGIASATVRVALYATFERLAERLRYVRVACGDWSRICTDSVTWRHGKTAVFLDPPYSDAVRTKGLYAVDSGEVAAEVLRWCREHGDDKRLAIALCGYVGEHDELQALGWDVVAWKAHGGYGGQRRDKSNDNATLERVWFSPGCERPAPAQASLFDRAGGSA